MCMSAYIYIHINIHYYLERSWDPLGSELWTALRCLLSASKHEYKSSEKQAVIMALTTEPSHLPAAVIIYTYIWVLN